MPIPDEEFALIHTICQGSPVDNALVVGNGDDGVVWRGASMQVSTVDMMIEGTHFRRDWSTPLDVATKLLVSNLSDIEAMGGIAQGALFGMGLPRTMSRQEREEWSLAFAKAFTHFALPVWGGDTVAADAMALSLTVIGEVPGRPLRRDALCNGMDLFVSAPLGASAAGLALLERGNAPSEPLVQACIAAHLAPTLRRGLGVALGRLECPVAAIDLSDGLYRSLELMSRASGVGLDVDWDLLPKAPGLDVCAHVLETSAEDWIWQGAENYSLLVGGPSQNPDFARLCKEWELVRIGCVRGSQGFIRRNFPQDLAGKEKGWSHF